jgi:hypothetical protein
MCTQFSRIALILALIAAVTSCRKLKDREEAQTKDYCGDTATRVCARYFSCHPVAAANGFGSEAECTVDMTDACVNSMKVRDHAGRAPGMLRGTRRNADLRRGQLAG